MPLTPHAPAPDAQALRLTTPDGAVLSATLFAPAAPSGAVLLSGGTGIPQVLYQGLAAYLAEQGLAVLTYDYRGIAASRPRRLRGFTAHIAHWGQHDAPTALEALAARYPGLPLYLLAHSMGGQIVGMMPNHHRLARVVAIASCTGYWRWMSRPFAYYAAAMWFTVIPLTTYLLGYAPARALRHGEDLPLGVARDWRRWCLCRSYFRPELGTRIAPVFYDTVRAPMHFVRIADDPIANARTVPDLMQLYTAAPLRAHVIEPQQLGVARVGHAGVFSRRHRQRLWPQLHALLVGQAEALTLE